jgi:hypothetical protein
MSDGPKKMRIVILKLDNHSFKCEEMSLVNFLRRSFYSSDEYKFLFLVSKTDPNDFILILCEGNFVMHDHILAWDTKIKCSYNNCGGGAYMKLCVGGEMDVEAVEFSGKSIKFGVVEHQYNNLEIRDLIQQTFNEMLLAAGLERELKIVWYYQ